ncbi:MAG: polymer-forming cytoskeletal protein [Rhodospirillaceae bacterium]|nr:polymer-forming cytoskeletal protein [Rhodospirillaceae bacterium]
MTDQDTEQSAAGGDGGDAPKIGTLPHFALKSAGVRPPIKTGLMGGTMSDRMSTSTPAGPVATPGPTPGADRAFMDRFTDRVVPSSSFAPVRRASEIPSPSSIKAAEAESEGKRLTIGRAVRVTGEISGCAHLSVEGTVDATVSEARSLDVSSTGVLKGKVEVDSAAIAGAFDGTLVVNGHLDIAATGQVRGIISYRALSIATGGKISGTITEIGG